MSPGDSWSRAARRLAQRVTRRERAGHVLAAVGVALCAGAALGLLLQALAAGVPRLLAPACGLLAGLALGLRRAARVPAVDAGAAAWALDRVAGAHGAGLAAAERDAAGSSPVPALPQVRLAPLPGLPAFVAGLLLAGLGVALPARTPPAQAAREDAGDRTLRVVGTLDATPGAAAAQAAHAAEGARLRAALGLPTGGEALAPGLEQALLEQALRQPALRDAARAQAQPGSAAAAALAGNDPATAGAALARALAGADAAARALEQARRAEAASAALPGTPWVPPARRALVARYLDAHAGGEGRR